MNSGFYLDGINYISHQFTLPLDYSNTDAKIDVFVRELVATSSESQDLPYLIYFQGGPGFASPRPTAQSGWLKAALQHFRVLLLDQRGTGLSSPISAQSLAHLSPEQQAEYISHFRADNIVRDADTIREQLNINKWSTIGQSFGGFCTLTYLSMFPDSLERCFVTGGLPSTTRPADDVYKATYQRTLDKNADFFERFPKAQPICDRIASILAKDNTYLPNGQRFTVEQFQQMGISFGVEGGAEDLYFQIEQAIETINGEEKIRTLFLHYIMMEQAYLTNPLYCILHESIYCQQDASNWSAHRVREQFPQFNYKSDEPLLFTGEMVYPWMLDQLETLKPLKEAAEILAAKSDWPTLYCDKTLAENRVPLAAAVYVEDMFVEFAYSCETLAKIPHSKAWKTNQYEHNGLRMDGETIFSTLQSISEQIKQKQQ